MIRSLVLLLGLFTGTQALAAGADFALTGIDGRTHRLSDYRGKWVVVNYWATWCPPCVEEMPELANFHERHKDKDAVVLGVNMEEQAVAADIASFVEQFLVNYPVLLSEPKMTALGPIPGLPTTFLVSPDGRVVAHKLGMVTAADIESFITQNNKN
ncbi:MAG: TlpA family protein disulfide reductase [Gammaproteobacteria bacterium]|nr:TlpA family protein disulfide reductase [Gammaproteobacteria bacterium]